MSEHPLSLKAKLTKLTYSYIDIRDDGIPEIKVKEIEAQEIPLEKIANAVHQNPPSDLEQSILLDGMQFPIIITKNTREEYDLAVKGLSNKNPYDPSKPYLNIIGNQRLTIAENVGFKTIDVFFVETGPEAVLVKRAYDTSSNR